MITDSETNFLYLSGLLQSSRYSVFMNQFEKALQKHSVPYQFLQNTKDIWAVDYMPVQISTDDFIQFVYNPDYLRNYKKWRETISDVDCICDAIQLSRKKSAILVDGGNVIKSKNKVIMCEKVFIENPNIPKDILVKLLKSAFETETIVLVPWNKSDFTGHADGMIRFLDEDTVFINDYSKEIKFRKKIIKALEDAGLGFIEVPYNPYANKANDQAIGIYVNFLQIQDIIFVPTFGIKEDDNAIKHFKKYFKKVEPVYCRGIAEDGGVLNCISWNIKND